MWELDYKESWVPKNWWFWTVVLEKTLESPLGCKEIKPVHPKGNQSWIFIGKTDAEAPISGHMMRRKNWLIGKHLDAGKDWRQGEKGMTEDEMAGWHHWLDGHEFEQALGVGDGEGSLACCSPWGHRVGHDWATELNWWRQKSAGPPWALQDILRILAVILRTTGGHLRVVSQSHPRSEVHVKYISLVEVLNTARETRGDEKATRRWLLHLVDKSLWCRWTRLVAVRMEMKGELWRYLRSDYSD